MVYSMHMFHGDNHFKALGQIMTFKPPSKLHLGKERIQRDIFWSIHTYDYNGQIIIKSQIVVSP